MPSQSNPPLDGPARGEGFLGLLADARTVELMRAVRDCPLGREELISRLDFGGSAFDRRVNRLTQMGVFIARQAAHDHRHREYLLTHCGRDLLEIGEELALAAASLDTQNGGLGAVLVKVATDPWDRAIVRVLLEASQPFNELLRLAHGTWHPDGRRGSPRLTAAGLSLRLERLEQLGLASRSPAPRRGAALYGAGDELWRLGRVAVRSALWRWRWTPACVPRMAGDLPGLVRMLAPRVRGADGEEIRVVLHVDAPPGRDGWPDVVVSLIDGWMTVRELALNDSHARASATPRVWCEALLNGEFDAIAIDGDVASARTVLAGLALVLNA